MIDVAYIYVYADHVLQTSNCMVVPWWWLIPTSGDAALRLTTVDGTKSLLLRILKPSSSIPAYRKPHALVTKSEKKGGCRNLRVDVRARIYTFVYSYTPLNAP